MKLTNVLLLVVVLILGAGIAAHAQTTVNNGDGTKTTYTGICNGIGCTVAEVDKLDCTGLTRKECGAMYKDMKQWCKSNGTPLNPFNPNKCIDLYAEHLKKDPKN